MKHAKARAHIRQLCCLGLGKEVIIPELLRILHSVIPSESNLFTGFGERMAPAYLISEYIVPEAVDVFVSEQERIFKPIIAGMSKWFSRHRVMPDPAAAYERFYQSDFYHLVLRPSNQHYGLQALIRHNGIPTGSLQLFRPQRQRPFGDEDQRQFEQILSYVEYGMRAGNEIHTDYADSGQAGMVVLTRLGKVVYISEQARLLLLLATHGVLPVGKQGLFNREIALPPEIGRICKNLDQIFRGMDTPPPVFFHTNPSGRFVFRAHWLQPPTANPDPDTAGYHSPDSGLIGVTIEHQEPLRLKLHRNLQGWRLSAREQEVCLALADGLSQTAIAARLHIGSQTVMTYVRRIYEKLGINSREELLKKLLASQPNNIGEI